MFSMSYYDTTNSNCNINIYMDFENDDVTLEELFSHFIDMTYRIGYQPGSWKRILEEAVSWAEEDDYNILNYASEKMFLS